MDMFTSGKKTEATSTGLPEVVFSWSFRDIFNKNSYKDKVKRIPEVFLSTIEYTRSFKLPLMEETRSSLCSGMESVGQSPACEITKFDISKDHKPPKELYYNIRTKKITDFKNSGGHYEPEVGDLVVLTNMKPRRTEDLIKPGEPLIIALVSTMDDDSDMTCLLLSKDIGAELRLKSDRLDIRVFATYLANLITNMRIWKALNPDPLVGINIVQKILRPATETSADCNNY